METKTISECLNFVDEVILAGINKVGTIHELEHIQDLMLMNGDGVDTREILSSGNLIIEIYYLNNQQTEFHELYTNLRKLIMKWLHRILLMKNN